MYSLRSLFILALLFSVSSSALRAQLKTEMIKREIAGPFNSKATSRVDFDRQTQYLYSTDVGNNQVEYWDYQRINKPAYQGSFKLDTYFSTISDIDANMGSVAVAGYSSEQSAGRVVIFDANGQYQTQVIVGALPREVRFDRINSKLLVSCAGAPNDDYSIDPQGSFAIININSTANNITQADVQLLDFTLLDTTQFDPGIRIFGNNGQQLASQDVEPAGFSISDNGGKAYLSLQKNNAMAVIDIPSASLDTIVALGYKDYGQSALDASDVKPSIDIRSYTNLFGMYQPDGMAFLAQNGQQYVLTANEGSARRTTGFNEVERVSRVPLDAQDFGNTFMLQRDTALGRLEVTTTMGNGNDVLFDSLFTFGGRSFSIRDAQGALIWDSGDEFEQALATAFPQNFNSSEADNNSYKTQSDELGPRPELITVAEIDGVSYALISLAEMGGIMIYDISDAAQPVFVQYEILRDFSTPASDQQNNDLGISDIEFIDAFASPASIPMIVLSHELTGTITTYIVGSQVSNEEFPMPTMEFYPNPSTGIFNAPYPGDFSVFDSQGRLVKEFVDVSKIDLQDQPKGFYLIKDEHGQSLRVIKK